MQTESEESRRFVNVLIAGRGRPPRLPIMLFTTCSLTLFDDNCPSVLSSPAMPRELGLYPAHLRSNSKAYTIRHPTQVAGLCHELQASKYILTQCHTEHGILRHLYTANSSTSTPRQNLANLCDTHTHLLNCVLM